MGCDIHLIAQHHTDHGWVTLPAACGHEYARTPGQCWRCDGTGLDQFGWWSDRNYALFSALAGVRRYSDTAPPFVEPRGYPDDFNPADIDDYDKYHSASWLTLEEVRAFDWFGRFPQPAYMPRPFLDRMEDLRAVTDKPVRIVFAFDN